MIGDGGLLQLFSDEFLPIGLVLICFCFHNEFNLIRIDNIEMKIIPGMIEPGDFAPSSRIQSIIVMQI